MSVQDAFYVQSLTNYLNDIKPYHSKILEVLVEYQYDDRFHAGVEDYLFTSTYLDSNWCQTYLLNGQRDEKTRTFTVPPVVVPRLLSSTGEATYDAYDALDFTGGMYYTNFPRPKAILVHPISHAALTPEQLGDTDTVVHGIWVHVAPVTIANGVATGGQITGFTIYNKLLWNPTAGTAVDNPDDPDMDASAVLTSIGVGLGFTPAVLITHPTGFGCKADCTLTSGSVTDISVRNQANVTARDVYRIKGQIDHRRLDRIAITQAGTGYVNPPIVRLLHSTVTGNPPIDDARVETYKRNYLTAVTINRRSEGYKTVPRITIDAPYDGGREAWLTSNPNKTLSDWDNYNRDAWLALDTSKTAADWYNYQRRPRCVARMYYDNLGNTERTYSVESVDIDDVGAGYDSAPSVKIHSYLERVELLTTGRGYDDGELTVQVLDDGVDRGAVVTATVVNGSITTFTVHDGGGYRDVGPFINDDTSVTVVIPAPAAGGIMATARAVVNGLSSASPALGQTSLIDIVILNPGSGYVDTPLVEVINDTSELLDGIDNLDLKDTDISDVSGTQPYVSSGTGMECRALMTGYEPWNVTVTLRDDLLASSRFKIGGPNGSLIQFNDGYAPATTDGPFTIDCAVLDSLEIFVNDKPVSIRTVFNVVIPNLDPSQGFGGSFSAPAQPEDLDDPSTVLTPDFNNITLANFDTAGYDGLETTALGNSTRTEFYDGVLRVGTLYAPMTTPENPTNEYRFIFDLHWWMASTSINDKLTICVAERDNYNPEVLTSFSETFTVSENVYLYEHFGVSFSGQYVKRSDGTVRIPPATTNDILPNDNPEAVAYAEAVGPHFTNDVMTIGLVPNVDFLASMGLNNPISQQLKFNQITKILNSPNAFSNSNVIAWQSNGAEQDIPLNTIIDPATRYDAQILKFDGVNRRSDGLRHDTYEGPTTMSEMTAYNNMTLPERALAYPATSYMNTRNTVHNAEFMSIQISPPGYDYDTKTWSTPSYAESMTINLQETPTPASALGYAKDMGYIGYYDSVRGLDPTGSTRFDTGVVQGDHESAGTSMTEDLLIINRIFVPGEFDTFNSDAGGWDAPTLKYEATAFKTVPPPDIVPGTSEISDVPLQVTLPIAMKFNAVTVRHSVPFRNNTVPTLIIEKWDEYLGQYVTLTPNVHYSVATIPSTIQGVTLPSNDTFAVNLVEPMSVRISYLWY